MTTREFYTAIINTEGMQNDLVEHATAALAKMDETNAKRKATPSKTQIENAPIMQSIVDYLNNTAGSHGATEIGAALDISRNKSASLCSKLYKEDKIMRVRDEKTGHWTYKAKPEQPAPAEEGEV